MNHGGASRGWRRLMTAACFVVGLATIAGARDGEDSLRRTKPPRWPQEVLDTFFEDARQQLVGQRPAPARPGSRTSEGGAVAARDENSQSFAWSQLIGGETLESEVKRLVGALREPLASPAKFKAGGYKDCRAVFSELAVLLAVIAEHDGEVRWKEAASKLGSRMAQAAMNCKTAADPTFNEAIARRTDLEELLRGERVNGDIVELERWSDLAERPLLMQRMEVLLQEGIQPALGNEKEFMKRAASVRESVELLSVLSEVMRREEYEYWDDIEFQELSTELHIATKDLRRATADLNYDAVRAAAGRTGQACSQCHEGYRG